MTVACCKDICPHTGHKARCIGCPRTKTCKDRDPSLPRVFPKLPAHIRVFKANDCNIVIINKGQMKNEQVVHVCLGDDRHYYFGSVAAIFDRFTPDELGVSLTTLWNYGLAPDRPYKNNRCAIYRGNIDRKKQTK